MQAAIGNQRRNTAIRWPSCLALMALAVTWTVQAGDSRLLVSYRDYAILESERFRDLDYAGDFSVEAWFHLPRGTLEGRYGVMLGKGRQSAREGGWFAGSTAHDYFEGLGHDASSGVYAPAGAGIARATNEYPGVIGDIHVVSVWNRRERTLTSYVNGVAKTARSPGFDVSRLKNSAPFLLNGNAYFAPPQDEWGGRSGEYYLARLWNRALSASEVGELDRQRRSSGRHALPDGFSRVALLSEWLMTETCDANGAPGTTHLRDSAGSNHLRLTGRARLERALGRLAASFPGENAEGVGSSVELRATGGRGNFEAPVLPIHYRFQVAESSTFDGATLKDSGWIAHRPEWQPVLRPGTTYYWRVRARDSSPQARETPYTAARAFTTRQARDWYVRPRATRGTYGREDGTSYENAFNGFRPSTLSAPPTTQHEPTGVRWGAGGVETGDTLYVAGRHYVDRHADSVAGNLARDAALYIGVDGYSADYPVSIRMDSARERGEVWNFGRRPAASIVWSKPDRNGVYRGEFLGLEPQVPVATGLDGAQPTLMRRAPARSWVGGPGQWFKDGRHVYVKMPDGGDPYDRLWEAGRGAAVVFQRRSFLRIEGCSFVGVSFEDYLGDLPYAPALEPRSHHVVFDRCRFIAGSGHLAQITMHRGNDHWAVRNSLLHHYANGIYAPNRPDPGTADFVTVEGNDIRHMGSGTYGYQGGDAHAVGLQNGSGWVIQDNRTEDTGTAIELWAGLTGDPSHHMSDHLVRRNSIRAARSNRATLGTGIAISGENGDSLGQRRNIRILDNVIRDVDGYAIASNNPDPVVIAGNTLAGDGRGGIALMSGDREPQGSIVRNLIIGANGDYLFISGRPGAWRGLDIDENCYLSPERSGSLYAAGKGRLGFAEWRRSTGFDPHGGEFASMPGDRTDAEAAAPFGVPCGSRGTRTP